MSITMDRLRRVFRRWMLLASAGALAMLLPVWAAAECDDDAAHTVRFVGMQDATALEVLDWGGDGPAVVFLASLGNTGHLFDDFAPHFSPEYRVIAITRRGFGASSASESGYDVATRAADILRALKTLGVERAIFVGHSIAGDELSYLGAQHAAHVQALVYLEAFDYGDGALPGLFAEIPADIRELGQATDRDHLSVAHMAAYEARVRSVRFPASEVCALWNRSASGALESRTGVASASGQVMQGTHEADFEAITAPALGIFAEPGQSWVRESHLEQLSEESRARLPELERSFAQWHLEQIVRFESRIPNGRAAVIDGAHHYVFLSNEGETVELMLEFLDAHAVHGPSVEGQH